MTLAVATATGPADLRDQRWLDERIAEIDDGIDAVLDIARNWTDGMNLSRLHPGSSAQDYILGRVKHPLGRGVVVPLLAESNWSNRQIAAVAGVGRTSVNEAANQLAESGQLAERPTETLGADGKLRAARVVREVIAEVIEPEEVELDLDIVTPDAVAESTAVWLADLRKYISGIVHVPPPPQTDERTYRRLRRGLIPALTAALDQLARDN
jgi:hypothetical protein